MLKDAGLPEGEAAFELANAFCKQARLRVDEHFARLWDNTDAADRALAKRVMSGRYAWQEDGVLDFTGNLPWIAEHEPGASQVPNVHRPIP
jgi:hypothetical protein